MDIKLTAFAEKDKLEWVEHADTEYSILVRKILNIVQEELQNWLDTNEHNRQCAAFSEGQTCCLYKITKEINNIKHD